MLQNIKKKISKARLFHVQRGQKPSCMKTWLPRTVNLLVRWSNLERLDYRSDYKLLVRGNYFSKFDQGILKLSFFLVLTENYRIIDSSYQCKYKQNLSRVLEKNKIFEIRFSQNLRISINFGRLATWHVWATWVAYFKQLLYSRFRAIFSVKLQKKFFQL